MTENQHIQTNGRKVNSVKGPKQVEARKTAQAMAQKTRKAGMRERISYGLGGFGKNVAYGLVSSYTLYYYNTILGISASFVGVLLMAARIFDAFNDPFMGVVVAKTKSRYGRYKPWIFSGSVLNALVMFAMFSAPHTLSGGPLRIYVSITYFLCGITYTLADIPYWAIIPAVTREGPEREQLTLYARGFAGVGAALPMMITMTLVPIFGGGDSIEAYRRGFSVMAILIAIVYVLTTLVMLKNMPGENITEASSASVGELFASLFKNHYAMFVAAVIILFNAAIYMTTNMLVYIFQFDIGHEELYSLYMIISGVTQFAAMLGFYPLMRRKYSNRRIFFAACGLAAAGYALVTLMVPLKRMTFWLLILPGICISMANGLAYVQTTIFISEAVDYGERQTGRRDNAVVSSLQTLMVKLSSAFAVFIAGIGIDLCHIDKTLEIQADASVRNLRILFSVPELVLIVAAFLIFRKGKLGEEHK